MQNKVSELFGGNLTFQRGQAVAKVLIKIYDFHCFSEGLNRLFSLFVNQKFEKTKQMLFSILKFLVSIYSFVAQLICSRYSFLTPRNLLSQLMKPSRFSLND